MPKKRNPGGCHCCEGPAPADPCNICFDIRDECDNSELTGAVISLNGNGTTTYSGRVVSLTLVNGGSGYTPKGWYSLNFTGGGGTGASGYFRVQGGVITTLKLINGGSGYTGSPTVTAPGTGSGASITATIATKACFYEVTTGDGSWSVTETNHQTAVSTVGTTVTCSQTRIVNMFRATTNLNVTVVVGCSPINATVTLSVGGGGIGSGTANAGNSGIVSFTGVPANVLVTITTAQYGYTTDVRTVTLPLFPGTRCTSSSVIVSLSYAAGFHCINYLLTTPSGFTPGTLSTCLVGDTLTLSGPIIGSIALNYDATTHSWWAEPVYSYPGCGDCPADSADSRFEVWEAGFQPGCTTLSAIGSGPNAQVGLFIGATAENVPGVGICPGGEGDPQTDNSLFNNCIEANVGSCDGAGNFESSWFIDNTTTRHVHRLLCIAFMSGITATFTLTD